MTGVKLSAAVLFSVMSCGAHADVIIRVLNLYQESAAQSLSEDGGPLTVFDTQLSKLNAALARSGVGVTVVSAGIPASISDLDTSLAGVLTKVQSDFRVQRLRDAADADIVILVTHFPSSGYSGYAAESPATAKTAFAVVDFSGMGPGGITYAHEFGHLLGAQHQESGAQDSTQDFAGGSAHGHYVRWHGLISTNPIPYDICYHTIMAYPPKQGLNGVYCNSFQAEYFSNPSITLNAIGWPMLGGPILPTGTVGHNNASQINGYAAAAATWRLTKLAKGKTAAVGLTPILVDD